MSKRMKITIILSLIGFLLAAGEMVALQNASWQHQRNMANAQINEIAMSLSRIDSAIRSGDKKQYQVALANYQTNIALIWENRYARGEYTDLLTKLRDYEHALTETTLVEELRSMRDVLKELSSVTAQKVENDEFSTDMMQAYRDAYAKAAEDLSNMEFDLLKPTREKYVLALNEIDRNLADVEFCAGICNGEEYAEAQRKYEETYQFYLNDFDYLNREISDQIGIAEMMAQLSAIEM